MWQTGHWLLIDAAGPGLIIGIIENGDWLSQEEFSDGFLESLKPGVESQLNKANLQLESLQGVICSSGPGSTLGLRLAAMFVRTLLQQPGLQHWQCLTYNNLLLACAGQAEAGGKEIRMGAPWRRDRLHLASVTPGSPVRFALETASPESVPDLPVVELSNRMTSLPESHPRVAFPIERIPQILANWPDLLTAVKHPDLYSAEDPEFVKWSSTRHPQK
jgi:hypothetical protein